MRHTVCHGLGGPLPALTSCRASSRCQTHSSPWRKTPWPGSAAWAAASEQRLVCAPDAACGLRGWGAFPARLLPGARAPWAALEDEDTLDVKSASREGSARAGYAGPHGTDPWARQQERASSLRRGQQGTVGTAQPCAQPSCKMWTALMLLWVPTLSSSLSANQVAPPDPRHLVNETLRAVNKTSEAVTVATPPPVMLTTGPLVTSPSSSVGTTGRTPGTKGSTAATAHGAPERTASPASTQQASSSTAATSGPTEGSQQALSSTTAPSGPTNGSRQALPSTAAPSGPAEGSPGSTLPSAVAPTTPATGAPATSSAQTVTASLEGTHVPPKNTPGHPTVNSTRPTSAHTPSSASPSTHGLTVDSPTTRPVANRTSEPMSTPTNTTLVPTPTVRTTTGTQAGGLAASTTPARATSPSPEAVATSPTTLPSPAPSTPGAEGPGTPHTPEQPEPEATTGTTSTPPTPGHSGGPKVPTTDSCQLSTQGQYLVVTTEPLNQPPVNQSFLLAVLVLGVTLFIAVLVLLALQAHESYKKKDYTQVDYLINGMYADSEM
ncbi:uncharacterized protein C11orf24 homolog [Talpa occidentalis]|uniref:uncharacterized protein C11orf24 homolog n=1 Tax=Talpa occidentalis TaxID=50954 RepID=UPI00188F847C|nr:uncharacterized protein C11orf24 homolog [Talpa occidentalis]